MSLKLSSKPILVISSYLWMLAACYFLDWKPFYLFLSYLIEFVVLFIFYGIIVTKNSVKTDQKQQFHTMNLIPGFFLVTILQYFIMYIICTQLDSELKYNHEAFLYSEQTLAIIGTFVLSYIPLLYEKGAQQLTMENVLYQSLALGLTNIIGLIMTFAFFQDNAFYILLIMTIARILTEIYFSRKMKVL